MKKVKFALAAAVAILLFLPILGYAHDDGSNTIRHMLMATFDKPGMRLMVKPITVYKSVAVAGWAQGDMGGRALLRKKNGEWMLVLCSGDALKNPKSLQSFGLSAEEAEAMAKAVVEAEGKVDPALVAKFATFDGVVMMDSKGSHPSAVGHGSQHKN